MPAYVVLNILLGSTNFWAKITFILNTNMIRFNMLNKIRRDFGGKITRKTPPSSILIFAHS